MNNLKEGLNRVSVPGRIIDLLLSDDEFYREVSSLKKASSAGKFPRCDQWCDEDGFHMAFALAGFSVQDIRVCVSGHELIVSGKGLRKDDSSNEDLESSDEYPAKDPNFQIQQGIIVRGIARRNFRTKYFMSSEFNLSEAKATMENGLLEIIVPRSGDNSPVNIDIMEK